MSEKKITLKVTVKPNGDNGWRTVCNAYPQIVGEGRSCEDALASLVGKIHEEFKEGTFKLDSQLIPAISCQITEMKANLILGTENYTLSDFIEEAEPEEMHECEDCGKGCSCVECLKAGEDTCGEEPEICCHAGIADEIYEMKQKEAEEKTPCDECSGYMKVCSGNLRDKYACPSSYPVCIKCENKQSLTYLGKEGEIVKFILDCKVHDLEEVIIDHGVCDTFNCEDYKYKVITEAEEVKSLYVWERLRSLEGRAHSGCRTCGNLIPAGKCRGNEKGNVCVNYTKGAYLDERCFDCNWSACDGEKRYCLEHQNAEIESTDVACSSHFSIKEMAKALAKSAEILKNDKEATESAA